jgi:hypothetical protein
MGTCEVWAWQQWRSGVRRYEGEGNGKRITAEKRRSQRKATANSNATASAESRRDAGATKVKGARLKAAATNSTTSANSRHAAKERRMGCSGIFWHCAFTGATLHRQFAEWRSARNAIL